MLHTSSLAKRELKPVFWLQCLCCLCHTTLPVVCTVLPGSRPREWQTLQDPTRQSIIKMSELAKDFLLLLLFLQVLVLSTFDMSKIGFYPEPPWRLPAYWWMCFHALEPRYLNNPGLICRRILLQQWYLASRCKVHSSSCCTCIFYFHNSFSVFIADLPS